MSRSCSVLGACAFPNCDCPVQPESETPLVERLEATAALWAVLDTYGRASRELPKLCNLLMEAATALSLAQTENKGHMRVVDELKVELAEVKADLADEAPARFQLQAALERAQTKWQAAQDTLWTGCTFWGLPPKQYSNWYDFMQSSLKTGVTIAASEKIAELEKALRQIALEDPTAPYAGKIAREALKSRA